MVLVFRLTPEIRCTGSWQTNDAPVTFRKNCLLWVAEKIKPLRIIGRLRLRELVLAGGSFGWLSQGLPEAQRQREIGRPQHGEPGPGRVGESGLENAVGGKTRRPQLGGGHGRGGETPTVAPGG